MNAHVIRAWKDEDYRLGLTKAERGLLPDHPAGAIELTDAELGDASGGTIASLAICHPVSWICPILTPACPYPPPQQTFPQFPIPKPF
jgi:mersacidin/lichenicidin family type 2 lantibiotic